MGFLLPVNKMYVGLKIASVLAAVLGVIAGSPCPKIFTYEQHPTGQYYGYLTIPNLRTAGSTAQLAVQLSTAANLGSRSGNLQPMRPMTEIMTHIAEGYDAEFMINFPSQNPLPYLLSVSVNGLQICRGSPAKGSYVTTSNLFYTLNIWVPPGVSHSISNTGIVNGVEGHSVQRFSESSRWTDDGFGGVYSSSYNVTRTISSGPLIEISEEETDEDSFRNVRPTPRSTTSVPRPVRPTSRVRTTVPNLRPTKGTTTTTTPTTTTSTTAKPTRAVVKQYSCGLPVLSRLQHMSIGGTDAKRGHYPWMAPLFDQDDVDDPKFICGSSIINKKYLITAAHCVMDQMDDFLPPERILAIPGMHNLDDFMDPNVVFSSLQSITVNDGYVSDDLNDADVALLRLKNELKFTDYIIPVCVWNQESDLDKVVGLEGTTAGWGLTENGQTKTPTSINSFIVSRQDCNQNLDRAYAYNAKIFCADGRGTVPCRGDSGSGMVIKRGNQFFLRGVVSKGLLDRDTLKCDTTKHAVYTDIAKFRHWMKLNIEN
ncbi:melanization protease 1-like [Uranotaenia lowii]|uniref:melanization protease 1-like n=1 Tax=Uranotaenia lowii TaxID=190385 RepID=UPI00247B15B6|nr:melanization protease 1-like [Uranotaenia lowii]